MTDEIRLQFSAADRWMVCQGAPKYISTLNVPNVNTKWSSEGTLAHKINDQALLTDKFPEPGIRVEQDGFEFKITDEMLEACNSYYTYVKYVLEYSYSTSATMAVEQYCYLTSLGVPGLTRGLVDCLIVDEEKKKIEVIDYKHGKGVVVEVKENPQIMLYALAALIKIESESEIVNIKKYKVKLTIVQPRAFHPRGPIRSWEIKATELYDWAKDIMVPAAKGCHEDNATLVPSEKGCRFCPAAGIPCPALYKQTQEIAMLDFKDEAMPDVEALSIEQKISIVEHVDMIRSFLVAIENQVRYEMESGSKAYRGKFKLVRKTAQRKLIEDAFDEDFSPLLDYLDIEDLYKKVQRGIGEIESVLKPIIKEKCGRGFTKEVERILDEVTDKPLGDTVVAPISDKRREVVPSIVSDFTSAT